MKVELLYFEGCPGKDALLSRMRTLLDTAGIEADLELVAVEDPELAERERFLGSPTVRVGGRDVEPGAEERTDFGLKCRLYRSPDGLSARPVEEWLLAALRAPVAAREP
jgi:hypothetical protein